MFRVWTDNDDEEAVPKEIDIAFTFGGDGTLLSLSRKLPIIEDRKTLPYIAAFNKGSLGYLCNFQPE